MPKDVIDDFKKTIEDVLDLSKEEVPTEIIYWDGTSKVFSSGKPPVAKIHIKSPEVIKELLEHLTIGFGENYMKGNLDIEGDLQEVLRIQTLPAVKKLKPSPKVIAELMLERLKTLNSRKQAKKNIEHHYGLNNEFYKLFLDKSLTYSCAYFKNWDSDTLEQAQNNKYELIVRKIGLKDGDRVVDIGCGWGGFLIYAAQKFDIEGVGCTISKNQADYANERIKELGLEKKIKVLCEDYRNMDGKFNKFVSIGAYEHVGKNYAGVFFKKLDKLLEDNAIGLLHTIGHNKPMETDAFTTKYIFPGGYLPSLEELIRHMRRVDFYVIDVENLRPHYAKTLDNWIERFSKNRDKVVEMYGEEFARMWYLYLNGASVSFKYGDGELYQILFSKGKLPYEKYPKYRGKIYENWN